MPSGPMDLADLRRRTAAAMPSITSSPAKSFYEGAPAARHEVRDLFIPAAFYALSDVMGFPHLGRGEKIAWEVFFKFRDIRCALALQKFGPRLYISAEDDPDETLSPDAILREIRAGADVVEHGLLQPIVERQMEEGNVTLINRAYMLRDMYEFFQELALREGPVKEPAQHGNDDVMTAAFDHVNREMRHERERIFHVVAATNAYFSALEHALVFLFVLSSDDLTGGQLVDFMRLKWWQKFKSVLDLDVPEEKTVYDRLRRVADVYRNPYSHGLLGRESGVVYAQVPLVGAIPAALSEWEKTPHLYSPFAHVDPAEVFDVFKACDEMLVRGKHALAMRYIESGLDLPCDPDSRARIRQASADEESMTELIRRWSYLSDQAANMDW